MQKRGFLFFLPAVLLLNIAHAQETKTVKIDSFIRKANHSGLFNGNIEVVEHNKVIYKQAIGYTDASKKTKLTTEYRFHIGSIAKEFNAVGIMMLKEKGKLSLDDKVSKYIKGLPMWADQISIQNLLQYTSGLPDVKWKTVKCDEDNWQDLRKLEKLDAVPGTNYAYNNNNTFLQRAIIAKISGMTFNDFVKEKILKPCGMTASMVDPHEQDPLVARSFDNTGKQDSLIVYPITGWTCVTLDDFYKWSAAINEFKLISQASTRSILTPFAEDTQAGLGNSTMEGNKIATHVHDGAAMHYQAILDAKPAIGRTVILMNSNKQMNIFELDEGIQAILDGKPVQYNR